MGRERVMESDGQGEALEGGSSYDRDAIFEELIEPVPGNWEEFNYEDEFYDEDEWERLDEEERIAEEARVAREVQKEQEARARINEWTQSLLPTSNPFYITPPPDAILDTDALAGTNRTGSAPTIIQYQKFSLLDTQERGNDPPANQQPSQDIHPSLSTAQEQRLSSATATTITTGSQLPLNPPISNPVPWTSECPEFDITVRNISSRDSSNRRTQDGQVRSKRKLKERIIAWIRGKTPRLKLKRTRWPCAGEE